MYTEILSYKTSGVNGTSNDNGIFCYFFCVTIDKVNTLLWFFAYVSDIVSTVTLREN